MSQEELASLDGERGIPSVHRTESSAKRRAMALFIVLIGSMLAGGAIYLKYKKQAGNAAGVEKSLRVGNTVPTRTFSEPPQIVPPPLPAQAPTAPIAAAPALPGAGVAPSASELDKSASSLMVSNQESPSPGEAGALPAAQSDEGNMSGFLTSPRTNRRTASQIGNRNFLLAKGAFIDCVLQTRLDTTVPGMTSCVVLQNIYSDNGKVLLIERGSTVSGEYQANMRQGMARIFVLWNRVKTPNGIVVNLDSPGTDPLGGAGLPGYVDDHFWKRFGAAIMLSLVDDTAQALTNSVNNNQLRFENTGDTTENMATEALRSTINIPPTLYKNQGERINIYVARDLDFSNVYDVVVE